MNNLFFFPKATSSKLEEAGVICAPYRFTYKSDGQEYGLTATKKHPAKLEEVSETWKIENDGLCINRSVRVEFPEVLQGPSGVVCRDAQLGVCIIWTNRTLTQMGYILPYSEQRFGGMLRLIFEHEFLPGEIRGDLMLETVLYVKTPAVNVEEDELSLINEAGVTVGELDTLALDFGNIHMEFPIIEIKDKNEPLWTIRFSQWEDPASTDLFTEDNVCLYLNSYYESCPTFGNTIKDPDILIEIMTAAYFLIFTKIADLDKNLITRIKNDDDLEPETICKAMQYFCASCDPALRFDSPDMLHRTIHQNIENMVDRMSRGEEDD